MTKQEYIERLQDMVSKNYITNIKDLNTQYVNEDGTTEPIEPYEDVLSPIGWNSCDRCGALHDSELGLMWIDHFPFEEDNEEDQHLLKALEQESEDYCALCWECVNELKHIDLK